MKKVIRNIILVILVVLIFSCEPISVSVNSHGEIAFARKEGVFFFNTKSNKLTTLDWQYDTEQVPIIVRWSPDEKKIAFTMKATAEAFSTEIYLINRNSTNLVKLFSTDKVVTQLEWSPDGKFLSYAQAGGNTDLNVADIGLYSIAEKSEKIVVKDTSDIHRWLDNNRFAFMSIKEKNPDNQEMFKADLSFYHQDQGKTEILNPVVIEKSGNLDCHSNYIFFTAFEVGDVGFSEDFQSTQIYLYTLNKKSLERYSPDKAIFVRLSPDKKNLLVTLQNDDDTNSLAVIKINNKRIKVLRNSFKLEVNTGSAEVMAYPEWLDNENILFFDNNRSYSYNGTALRLMKQNVNSRLIENLQVPIDQLIDQEVKSRGGY
ncbi:MAG: hypothetical protein MJB14_07840 [Spirochaetes bacterium]|nr:hypothetical protein [Spirochaetota bacterium]